VNKRQASLPRQSATLILTEGVMALRYLYPFPRPIPRALVHLSHVTYNLQALFPKCRSRWYGKRRIGDLQQVVCQRFDGVVPVLMPLRGLIDLPDSPES